MGWDVGRSEGEWCVPPDELQLYRGIMTLAKSYRRLGPDDLNQFSISLYSEHAGGGKETIYTNLRDYDLKDNLPKPVLSYMITGISNSNTTNQNTTMPVFRVNWEDPSEENVCLALINKEDEDKVAKMYVRARLERQPDEPIDTPTVEFGSFYFFRYSTVLLLPTLCDGDHELIKLPPVPEVP